MSEMRSRIDPRLALLPEGLQTIIRSSRHYHRSRAYVDSAAGVHAAEQMTSDCETLFEEGAVSATEVLEALEHPRPEIREVARRLVGWLRWRRAAPFLLRQFETQDEERKDIGDTLAKLDSRRARKRLLHWMASSPDAEFRWQAALSLFWDGDVSLVGPFLAALSNASETDKIRRLAIEGVSVCLDGQDRRSRLWRSSTEALMPYLDHPKWEYRWEAAFALGQAGARKALPRLREMAKHDREIEENNRLWPMAEIISWLE